MRYPTGHLSLQQTSLLSERFQKGGVAHRHPHQTWHSGPMLLPWALEAPNKTSWRQSLCLLPSTQKEQSLGRGQTGPSSPSPPIQTPIPCPESTQLWGQVLRQPLEKIFPPPIQALVQETAKGDGSHEVTLGS